MRSPDTKFFKTAAGPVEITVVQIPAMQSGHLLMRLAGSIGPALAGVAGALDLKSASNGEGGFDIGKVDLKADALPPAVSAFFAKFDGKELEHLTRTLLNDAQANVNGDLVPVMSQFDTLFRGQIAEWFKLLWFALGVNYGNFFDALAGLGVKIPGLTGKPSPSTTSHNGSSGLRKG